MVIWKRKRPLITSKWNSAGVETSVSFLKPYNFLITCCGRSKGPYFRFFNKLPAPLNVRSKWSYFFSLKSIEISSSTQTLTKIYLSVLDNHCSPRFDSQDWKPPTDFSSGCLCWTREQRSIRPRIKNSSYLLDLLNIEKKSRTANIGKGWPNWNHEKNILTKSDLLWVLFPWINGIYYILIYIRWAEVCYIF